MKKIELSKMESIRGGVWKGLACRVGLGVIGFAAGGPIGAMAGGTLGNIICFPLSAR